jgi:hypothetical protein
MASRLPALAGATSSDALAATQRGASLKLREQLACDGADVGVVVLKSALSDFHIETAVEPGPNTSATCRTRRTSASRSATRRIMPNCTAESATRVSTTPERSLSGSR